MSLRDRLKDARVITQEEIDAMSPRERREHHLCQHDLKSHGACNQPDCFCKDGTPDSIARDI